MKNICTMIGIYLFVSGVAFAGTANCEEDKHCKDLICPKLQKSYCDIILGTTGPHGKAMGFCKCHSFDTPSN